MFVSSSRGTCLSNTQADASAYVWSGCSMNTRLIYALLMVCLSWTAVAWSAEEGEAIERTVKEAAMAPATFSETRDRQAVLKLYTKDYVGIQDGETETRDSIEKWLSDYESELDKGSTLRFISAVSNLHVRMPGPTAWATYDYVFQAIRKGELEAQDSGQCTTLLRKEGSTWLIQHEHCSKIRTGLGK
jgi:ketosteroid isomerase-like protein